MAKVTKNIVDKDLRDRVFEDLVVEGRELDGNNTPIIKEGFHKINDRQYGVILTDLNGEQRYIRIGAIVAELREDMTAEELMQSEIDAYEQKQADKAEAVKKRQAKAEKDKVKREAQKNKEDK